MTSGLSCVAAGAAAGVVGLVAMPVMGAKEGYASRGFVGATKGLAAGLGKGVAGALVL